MDHNLEDSLNLDGAMETIDFDHSGVVVNQADISLEASGHEGDLPMEFEEQQMLMDPGNEEIIVPDFMGDQFTLQYGQDDQIVESTATVEMDQINVITSQSDATLELQQPSDSMPQSFRHEISQSRFTSIKLVHQKGTSKKSEPAPLPRQVAIAPKPPKMAQGSAPGKQYSLAPRPVPLNSNKVYKKVPLTNLQQGKKNTVLVRMGKQVFILPPGVGAGHKFKLVSGGPQNTRHDSDQAQLISTKAIGESESSKSIMTKVIVQAGQSKSDLSNQPAVITKLGAGAPHARYVMQQKTVPVSLAANRELTSTKQTVQLTTKLLHMKSPKKTTPAPQATTTTKKVVISTKPNKNVMLKTTAPTKPQVSKETNVPVQGQRSQLHQINVPGKGIQYIRVLNPETAAPAPPPVPPPAPPPAAPPAAAAVRSFVLTDTIGNIIQMAAQKMITAQQPALIISGNVGGTVKVPVKPERKLVRIAPVTSKPASSVTSSVRSSQSLLAPLSPMKTLTVEGVKRTTNARLAVCDDQYTQEGEDVVEEHESKEAVRALIAETAAEEERGQELTDMHEVEIEYEREQNPENDVISNSMDDHEINEEDHPLIVIPSHFGLNHSVYSDSDKQREINYSDDDSRPPLSASDNMMANLVNVEAEIIPYQSPTTPDLVDSGDLVTDLGMRPRKACNCTKSQCLKLYCDCFANGEFCNNCNCNNCHNNLENEYQRQKAIRACLDRNPNAFRPKIGKAKLGGPEIIRRHNKGCNCKRSGCLKNYCECYEARIACTAMCKCVGCRNVEDCLERRRDLRRRHTLADAGLRAALPSPSAPSALSAPAATATAAAHAALAAHTAPGDNLKQPCSFMTAEVIEAVCQCLIAAAVEGDDDGSGSGEGEGECSGSGSGSGAHSGARDVIEEFARCLQEIIGASHHAPLLLDQAHA